MKIVLKVYHTLILSTGQTVFQGEKRLCLAQINIRYKLFELGWGLAKSEDVTQTTAAAQSFFYSSFHQLWHKTEILS